MLEMACASGDGDGATLDTNDAAGGLPPLGSADGSSPGVDDDAGPTPGDVCGDRSGLQKNAPWPLRGGCPTRAGWSFSVGPKGASEYGVPVAGGASSPAVVAATGIVWVGTEDGLIVAADNSGLRYAKATGGPVRSSPAIDADGVAIAVGGDGVLYGLVAEPGVVPPDASLPEPTQRFSIAIGKTSSSPVIASDRSIYIGTGDGKLARITKDLGAIEWGVDTHDTSGGSPALGQDGTIYLGSSDHHLYAVTPAGATKWAFDLEDEVRGSAVVGGDGTVYVATSRRLWAVTPAGTMRWSHDLPAEPSGEPAVYAGAVYIGASDKKLHAVGTTTGAELWSYETLGVVATPVLSADGTIYVGSTDSRLYALNTKGGLLFAVIVKGKVTGAPAFSGSASLYVMTDSRLVTIGP